MDGLKLPPAQGRVRHEDRRAREGRGERRVIMPHLLEMHKWFGWKEGTVRENIVEDYFYRVTFFSIISCRLSPIIFRYVVSLPPHKYL